MKKSAADTRRRIIEAAGELFYGDGVRSVGVDTIAEKAGVTKRTLYYHFTSKDELITEYLQARNEPTIGRYRAWFEGFSGTLAERIAGVFTKLAKFAENPKWKGCGFARAAAELAGLPGHPAIAVASKHKHDFEAWLAELLAVEDVTNHLLVARQLMVLLDGAITQILIHRDSTYAVAAGRAAADLIEAAKNPPLDRDISRRSAKRAAPNQHAANAASARRVAAR
jgi:AcrR family transcriptional regulator